MTTPEASSARERLLARLLGGDFLLWSPNIQAEAYRSWDEIFAVRGIARGTPKPIRTRDRTVEIVYSDHGATKQVDDFIRDEHLSGLLVIKDEQIVLERYALGLRPHLRWQSSSMVKSLASCLVGAAVDDGSLDGLDQPLTMFVPELSGSAYEGVTIRHLLTMSSGIDWNENTEDFESDVTQHYIRPIAARQPGAILAQLNSRKRAARMSRAPWISVAVSCVMVTRLRR